MSPREVRVRAFAKINLDLRVLFKRTDGFHELRTVFQTVSLADRISIRYRLSDQLRISVSGTVEIADNIIARAARLVMSELEASGEIDFDLEKRIPMGAGLGGGSSDAAAVLLALPALVGRRLPLERLHSLASQLGSDVPFFLYGGTAFGIGRGEEIYPAPERKCKYALLAASGVHVSTAEAYGLLSAALDPSAVPAKLQEFVRAAWAPSFLDVANDFEPPVFQAHPQLAEIRASLEAHGALCARMTGSGSALFGLFPDAAKRHAARRALPSVRTYPVSFVDRKAYRRAWAKDLSVSGLSRA